MPRSFPLEFGNQSNPGRDGQDGTARLLNAYAEFAGVEGKSPFPIYAIEGMTRLFWEDTSTGIRGMLPFNGSIYTVAGQQVFKVTPSLNPDGTYTSTTTLLGGMPGVGTVYMDRNQNATSPQIALVHEGTQKVIQADSLSELDDLDLPPANSVTSLGGYLIFTIPDGRYYITAINDITVNALDFGLANQFPDRLLRGLASNGNLWLFGEGSIEIHANTGNADFPFQLISGAVIEKGTLSGASVDTIGPLVFWVDDDGSVQAASGSTPQRISLFAVERSISEEPDQANITGTAYSYRGHQYYAVSGSTFTWVYDLTIQKWHERKSYQRNRWRGERYAKLNNIDYVGDSALGRIYQIDANVDTEDGEPIIWEVTAPIVHAGAQRLSHTRIDLDVLTGVGKNTTVDSALDPQIELRYSDDGEKTHSNWVSRALGKIGEYSQLVQFKRLGLASRQGRSYTVRASAAVCRGLLGATLRIK